MRFKIIAIKIELSAGATLLKLTLGHLMCPYELMFQAHIAKNDTSTLFFIKIDLIK